MEEGERMIAIALLRAIFGGLWIEELVRQTRPFASKAT